MKFEKVYLGEFRQRAVDLYLSGKSSPAVAKELGCSRWTVAQAIKAAGVKARDCGGLKYSFNHDFFEDLETCEKAAYWAGFIAADGCVTERNTVEILLGGKDFNHLEKFVRDIGGDNRIYHEPQRKGYRHGRCHISLQSAKMSADLAIHSIVPRKTFTVQWPNLSDASLRHYLRGYVDGDGCLYRRPPGGAGRTILQSGFALIGNQRFIECAKSYLIRTCNLSETKTSIHANGKNRIIRYLGNVQVARIAHFLYHDANIYLDRKAAIAFEIVDFNASAERGWLVGKSSRRVPHPAPYANDAKALYEKGATLEEIALKYGVTRVTIKRQIVKVDGAIRKRGRVGGEAGKTK